MSITIFDVKCAPKLTLGRTKGGGGEGRWLGGRVVATPLKVFLIFFLDDKTLAPKVFCSCSFIPGAHFDTSLVMNSYYGYEI